MMGQIDFNHIKSQALLSSRSLVPSWLPGGRIIGREYIIRNPTRVDNNPGSFRINLQTGHWADFAIDEKGGDLISLYAYINNTSQTQAAISVASVLGLNIANKPRLQRTIYR